MWSVYVRDGQVLTAGLYSTVRVLSCAWRWESWHCHIKSSELMKHPNCCCGPSPCNTCPPITHTATPTTTPASGQSWRGQWWGSEAWTGVVMTRMWGPELLLVTEDGNCPLTVVVSSAQPDLHHSNLGQSVESSVSAGPPYSQHLPATTTTTSTSSRWLSVIRGLTLQ